MNANPESLYARLTDGRYLREFPEDFFAPVQWCDGRPMIETCRRKKVNLLESFYEWTIFFTGSMELVPDYLNKVATFYPTFYMMRLRSRQNNLLDIEIDSIYNLASSAFTPIYIDVNTNQESPNGMMTLPSSDYRWGGTKVAAVQQENKEVVRKIIPVSLDLNYNKTFGVVFDDIKKGRVSLPEVFDFESIKK